MRTFFDGLKKPVPYLSLNGKPRLCRKTHLLDGPRFSTLGRRPFKHLQFDIPGLFQFLFTTKNRICFSAISSYWLNAHYSNSAERQLDCESNFCSYLNQIVTILHRYHLFYYFFLTEFVSSEDNPAPSVAVRVK